MRSVLVLAALFVVLCAGCAGLPDVPDAPTAAIGVIDAIDATTNETITVDAVAILGGVRGTITVAEGSVVLRNVPFGTSGPPTQPLTVTAPGYVTFAEPIQISMTVVTFYTAALEPADLSETGTVRGVITSTTGQPIPSALVKFTHIAPGGATEVRGYTDNDGQYVIGGIPIGVSTVTAEAEGFVTSDGVDATVVQDEGGGVSPDVNLALVPGTTQVGVRGIVVDSFTDTVLPGARIVFGDVATVTSDATGSFSLDNVLVGTYDVTVTLDGYDEYTTSVDVLPGMARLRFAMTPAAPEPPTGPYNVQGTVTLIGATDNSGAVVTAVDTTVGATWATVTTPASGEYTMFLPPGEYRITATADGRSVRRTVTVPSGGRVLRGIDFVIALTS
jgi:hypothetical protein